MEQLSWFLIMQKFKRQRSTIDIKVHEKIWIDFRSNITDLLFS